MSIILKNDVNLLAKRSSVVMLKAWYTHHTRSRDDINMSYSRQSVTDRDGMQHTCRKALSADVGPSPAYVGPTEPSDVGEIVYSNPNGTYTGAPLSMPLSDNGFVDQPNPLSPSTLCYRMNSTIYYEPGNSTYLDPSQGTSNELMTAISEQAYDSGVWVRIPLSGKCSSLGQRGQRRGPYCLLQHTLLLLYMLVIDDDNNELFKNKMIIS